MELKLAGKSQWWILPSLFWKKEIEPVSSGNHSLAILKVIYAKLCDAMQDILKSVTINGKEYNIKYVLGRDMKFLGYSLNP